MEEVNTVAKGIGDFGMMAVTAAFFLVLAGGLMVACFKWFKAIINRIVEQQDGLKPLMDAIQENVRLMNDIAEGLRPETMLRIKNTTGVYFDLAVERVCRMIRKVRDENHIADREATVKKIRTLLQNIHEDRNSRFDQYTYRGKKLTTYTSPEWVSWVEEVVETEVYDESINNGRSYTNVCAVYERIKIDFYRKLNGE